jgi:serine/threonine-protein kinase RsbW
MNTSHTLIVAATAEGLRQAEEGLDEFSTAHGLTRNDTWPFFVAVDEILSNIPKYDLSERGVEGRVEIQLHLEPGTLEMVILDDAAPFNPLEAERPDTSLAVEEREVGGLGLEIVRRLMDVVENQREDPGWNRLRLRRRLGLAPAE